MGFDSNARTNRAGKNYYYEWEKEVQGRLTKKRNHKKDD